MKKNEIKLKNEQNTQTRNQVIFNQLVMAVAIMIYFIALHLGYKNIKLDIFELNLKVYSICLLIISIIVFENAYKKDSGTIAIYGIECLVLATITLLTTHIVERLGISIPNLLVTFSYVFAIYYIFKSMIIYTKEEKAYLNTLSDIKEIVKKDEPQKKEASKKNKTEKNRK